MKAVADPLRCHYPTLKINHNCLYIGYFLIILFIDILLRHYWKRSSPVSASSVLHCREHSFCSAYDAQGSKLGPNSTSESFLLEQDLTLLTLNKNLIKSFLS